MTETTPPRIPVFDGHNDTLLHMANLGPEDGDWSFFKENNTGHIDLPRARRGNMIGGFFAILAPHARGDGDKLGRSGLARDDDGYRIPMAPSIPFAEARDYTAMVIEILSNLERESDGDVFIVRGFDDLKSGIDDGNLAVLLHFEGAEAIDEDLEMLNTFYDQGLRSIGIVWSRHNAFGHGVPFRYPCSPDTGPGLTDSGRRLVKASNDMGIVIDMAHLNEAGFWDVEAISNKPLVVSHACCHAICPSARNLTDRQLDAIGATNGLVGINFFVGDLRDDGKFIVDTPLEQIVDHINYVVDRIGIDHVAFGSDFDGARVPEALGDVAGLPRLVGALRDHGYDEQSLHKIAHKNWLRVLRETLKP